MGPIFYASADRSFSATLAVIVSVIICADEARAMPLVWAGAGEARAAARRRECEDEVLDDLGHGALHRARHAPLDEACAAADAMPGEAGAVRAWEGSGARRG